ncbi:hypothetical protein D9M70_358510 [compost metagenome]
MRPAGDLPPVDNRHARRQRRLGFDLDIAIPTGEKLGAQQIGDDRRVVQRAAIGAVFLDVEAFEEFEHLGHGDRRAAADVADLLHPRLVGEHAMGDVERHHHDRNARAEDDIGGFRIDIDVELGRRRDVAAFEEAAAHHHQFLHPRRNLRRLLERERDVGERSQRAERHRALCLVAECFDDEVDRVLLLEFHPGLIERRSVEAGLAVHVLGGDQRTGDRLVGAGKNPNLRPVAELAENARIAGRQGQRHVAGDRGDAEQVDLFRTAESEHDGGGIVLPGIGVYDYLSGHGHSLVLPGSRLAGSTRPKARRDRFQCTGADTGSVACALLVPLLDSARADYDLRARPRQAACTHCAQLPYCGKDAAGQVRTSVA